MDQEGTEGVPLPSYAGSVYEARNDKLMAVMPAEPGQALLDFTACHPQMVDSYVLLGVLNKIPTVERGPGNPLYDKILMLQRFRPHLVRAISKYPVGPGPIEQVWQEAVERRVSFRYALSRMHDDYYVWSLSWPYLRALSRHAYLQVQDNVRIRDGWLLQEMVLNVAEAAARPTSLQGEFKAAIESLLPTLWNEAAVEWMLAASVVLAWNADGRIYRRAEVIGTRLVANAREAGDEDLLGRALHRWASIYQSAYTGVLGVIDQHGVRYSLRRRFQATLGPADSDGADWTLTDVPPQRQGLAESRVRYREAAAYRSGTNRALSLKGFSETSLGLRRLGDDVDADEIATAADEALQLFDPVNDNHLILALQSVLQRQGIDYDRTGSRSRVVQPCPSQPTTAWSNRRPERLSFEARLVKASNLADSRPAQALRSLVLLHDEARRLGTAHLVDLWNEERRILRAIASGPERIEGATIPRAVRVLSELVNAAVALRNQNRESEALELMGRLPVDVLGDLAALQEMLDHERMHLHVGAAVNSVTESPADSVEDYSAALSYGLALGLEDIVADMLRRIGWIARDVVTAAVAKTVARQLRPFADAITGLGATVQYEFFRCCQYAFTAGAMTAVPEKDAIVLRQMIKGWNFAGAIQHGGYYSATEDPEGQLQLAAIEKFRGDGSGEGVDVMAGATFLSDRLLVTYVSDREVRDGRTADERRQNLERVFDQRVFNPAIRRRAEDHTSLSPGDIRERLDNETVLLDILLACNDRGALVVYTWIHTADASFIISRRSSALSGRVEWGGDADQLLRHPVADLVQRVREEVAAFPGPARSVSRKGAELLDEVADVIFGGARGLNDLVSLAAKGKKRLIVIPHGPLHYFPFHLLPLDGQTLSEVFAVTVLPNLALLTPRPQSQRTIAMRAFAMSFQEGNPFKLPPIEASVQEARDIAALFQDRPIVDAEATTRQFRQAVEEARQVHISTHGENVASGGAFQRLYLSPDAHADGRLHAYEVLDLNLHGLELLSMSACETALGRFDLLDNLRGLPAAFLLRGTGALVGTLWPAEVEVAREFFTTMYQHRKSGSSTITAAFAVAQAAIRATHPQYRDWGPFYMIGAD